MASSIIECSGCDVDLSSAYCWDLGLEGIPPCLPESLTYLDVYRGALVALTASAFLALQRLEILYLDDDQLELLEPGVLAPLNNLTQLGLAGNKITQLHEQLFATNDKLRLVDLSQNRLTSVSTLAFQSLGVLERLFLQGNQLTSVEGVAAAAFPGGLRVLDLSDNLLASLEPAVLSETRDAVVALHGNPWLCDCRTSTIVAAFTDNNVTLAADPTCAAPPSLQGRLWSQLEDLCTHQ